MQILHFSDIHGNRRAIDAIVRVARNWKNAFVAVTGDICAWEQSARTELNKLNNSHIWFVRGNHDVLPFEQFSELPRVQWKTPYLNDLKSCVLMGLDSEENISIQLQDIAPPKPSTQKKVLVVLHHRPFSREIKQIITSWSKNCFPSITSIALLHGHEHHNKLFFAKNEKEYFEGFNIITSHVYSANMNFKAIFTGSANLITIRKNGAVSVKPVLDPNIKYQLINAISSDKSSDAEN